MKASPWDKTTLTTKSMSVYTKRKIWTSLSPPKKQNVKCQSNYITEAFNCRKYFCALNIFQAGAITVNPFVTTVLLGF